MNGVLLWSNRSTKCNRYCVVLEQGQRQGSLVYADGIPQQVIAGVVWVAPAGRSTQPPARSGRRRPRAMLRWLGSAARTLGEQRCVLCAAHGRTRRSMSRWILSVCAESLRRLRHWHSRRVPSPVDPFTARRTVSSSVASAPVVPEPALQQPQGRADLAVLLFLVHQPQARDPVPAIFEHLPLPAHRHATVAACRSTHRRSWDTCSFRRQRMPQAPGT